MKRDEDDYAVLLEAADTVEADLARNLLSEAGIPAFVQGPDFDVHGLVGIATHASVHGTKIYVSKEDLERAQSLLEDAWGKRG